jgi:hypothetical protein
MHKLGDLHVPVMLVACLFFFSVPGRRRRRKKKIGFYQPDGNKSSPKKLV